MANDEPELDPFLAAWVRRLYERVGRVLFPSFEQWESCFLCDMNLGHEILTWEAIARTFEDYLRKNPEANRKVVVGDLLAISMVGTSDQGSAETRELGTRYTEIRNWIARDIKGTVREVEQALADDLHSAD